jgi:hypothetical protein
MTDAKEDPRTPSAGKDSKEPGLDSSMSKKEKDRMANQMEEFEGPERREVRGDECDPPKDPGVSNS